MKCPHDDNEMITDHTEGGWYYWHCPGCGNEFTMNGTQVGTPIASREE